MAVAQQNFPGKGMMDPASIIGRLDLRPGMRVADFGCGSGHFTVLVAKLIGEDGKVTAIDVQNAALDSVRAKIKDLKLQNIETVRADLEVPGATKLADGSQDLVLLANVIFQSQKKDAIIREAKRVLKTGGKLVLIEWKKGSGGFGPPDDLRMTDEAIETLVTQEGFEHRKDIDVGQFHHILIFAKD